MNLIEKTRHFLSENAIDKLPEEKIDYLLVNSTNEFLVEYPKLDENARYLLTNFSGSAGDALISANDLFLFVDGRYHQQADLEVNPQITKVVKMKFGQSFSNLLAAKIKPNKTLAIVAKKNSQGRYEILKEALAKKSVRVRLLDFDPVIEFYNKKTDSIISKIEQISLQYCGIPADEKFKKLSDTIQKNDAILITNLEEISYLCNLRDFSSNFSSNIKAKCLVMKDYAILFTDSALKPFSQKFKIKKLSEFDDYVKKLKNIPIVFVDKISANAHDYMLLCEKAAPQTKSLLKEMKSIKTNAEIEHYKKCFERTDKTLFAIREYIENNENLSEHDIATKLEEEFYKNGAKSLSFKEIVAINENSALAHYSKKSKEKILTEGSLVLIDCGAYYEGGLATDCTRVFVKGTPSNLQKRVYTTVLKGFLAAFNKNITSRTTGYKIDRTARKILDKEAPRGFHFSHALGHGLGISVHENPPSLSASSLSKTLLAGNMCFTIEPGLYKKNFGGVRLENSCYLEEKKSKLKIKSFTKMCFEKKLIDFNLLSKQEQKWLKAFEVR